MDVIIVTRRRGVVPEQITIFLGKILNMISSKTSFIALIGNPVSHSLSPIMQNAALQYLGLDLIYIAIPCKDEDLELVLNLSLIHISEPTRPY